MSVSWLYWMSWWGKSIRCSSASSGWSSARPSCSKYSWSVAARSSAGGAERFPGESPRPRLTRSARSPTSPRSRSVRSVSNVCREGTRRALIHMVFLRGTSTLPLAEAGIVRLLHVDQIVAHDGLRSVVELLDPVHESKAAAQHRVGGARQRDGKQVREPVRLQR